MTEFDKVMNMLNKNVELSSEKVELGIIDNIASMKKEDQKFVADAYKADATIKAAADKINAAWKVWGVRTKMATNHRKILDGYVKQLEKQSADLGLDPKQLPVWKDAQDIYQALDELDDVIGNMQGYLKSIGK